MKFCGVIAAVAALFITGSAGADEASVQAVLARPDVSSTVGVSSYYGPGFHGRKTADGEIFDMHGLSAAHKTLPIPCYARVTNLRNGHSVVVRVNDRGPYIAGRMLDVSARVARLLDYNGGLERVRLDYLGKAGPAGAEDQRALLASLDAGEGRTIVAKAQPKPRDAAPTHSALAFADARPKAPAAAALEAALRPSVDTDTPPKPSALSVAASLDASARKLEAALEAAHRGAEAVAHGADVLAQGAAEKLSPYGKLVLSPFKPLVEASR